jgi:hypothetical protein
VVKYGVSSSLTSSTVVWVNRCARDFAAKPQPGARLVTSATTLTANKKGEALGRKSRWRSLVARVVGTLRS